MSLSVLFSDLRIIIVVLSSGVPHLHNFIEESIIIFFVFWLCLMILLLLLSLHFKVLSFLDHFQILFALLWRQAG